MKFVERDVTKPDEFRLWRHAPALAFRAASGMIRDRTFARVYLVA
jgi:hypothetical protein